MLLLSWQRGNAWHCGTIVPHGLRTPLTFAHVSRMANTFFPMDKCLLGWPGYIGRGAVTHDIMICGGFSWRRRALSGPNDETTRRETCVIHKAGKTITCKSCKFIQADVCVVLKLRTNVKQTRIRLGKHQVASPMRGMSFGLEVEQLVTSALDPTSDKRRVEEVRALLYGHQRGGGREVLKEHLSMLRAVFFCFFLCGRSGLMKVYIYRLLNTS